jgi:uncharacterized membrane protein YcgQ (UPF0703/DUF1980 family)
MYELLLLHAGQVPTEAADFWPWVVGILCGVVTTLFALLLRAYDTATKRVDAITELWRKSDDERTRRITEEFAKKDAVILETSTEFARMMERVVNELREFNDRR